MTSKPRWPFGPHGRGGCYSRCKGNLEAAAKAPSTVLRSICSKQLVVSDTTSTTVDKENLVEVTVAIVRQRPAQNPHQDIIAAPDRSDLEHVQLQLELRLLGDDDHVVFLPDTHNKSIGPSCTTTRKDSRLVPTGVIAHYYHAAIPMDEIKKYGLEQRPNALPKC
jgi:hypothetical protein